MPDAYHAQVCAQLEQARTELAQLHQGEEEYTDDRLVPTPGQWIWSWNRETPAGRLSLAAYRLELLERANRCTWEMHATQVAELYELRQSWTAQAAEMARLRQLLRAAEDELAMHRQRAAGRPVETRHLVEIHRDGVRVHGDGELTGTGSEALAALLTEARVNIPARATDLADVPSSELTPEWRAYLDIDGDSDGP